jgi:hypothetical protein
MVLAHRPSQTDSIKSAGFFVTDNAEYYDLNRCASVVEPHYEMAIVT